MSQNENQDQLIEEIIDGQKKVLLEIGRRIVPTLTPEDMLQPNDYPVLENHPHFRYEEGVLAGMQSIQIALRAESRKKINHRDTENIESATKTR